MATPRLGLVVEDKPTELSCIQKFKDDSFSLFLSFSLSLSFSLFLSLSLSLSLSMAPSKEATSLVSLASQVHVQLVLVDIHVCLFPSFHFCIPIRYSLSSYNIVRLSPLCYARERTL